MKGALLTQPLTHANVEQIADQFAMPDLLLPFWGYRKKMPMHRIVRLEGEGNYTLFHFADGSQLMVSLTLKKWRAGCHRKCLFVPTKKTSSTCFIWKAFTPTGSS